MHPEKGGYGKDNRNRKYRCGIIMRGNLVAICRYGYGLSKPGYYTDLKAVSFIIFDVIEENCDLDEALIKDTRYENLYFVPGSANA